MDVSAFTGPSDPDWAKLTDLTEVLGSWMGEPQPERRECNQFTLRADRPLSKQSSHVLTGKFPLPLNRPMQFRPGIDDAVRGVPVDVVIPGGAPDATAIQESGPVRHSMPALLSL